MRVKHLVLYFLAGGVRVRIPMDAVFIYSFVFISIKESSLKGFPRVSLVSITLSSLVLYAEQKTHCFEVKVVKNR